MKHQYRPTQATKPSPILTTPNPPFIITAEFETGCVGFWVGAAIVEFCTGAMEGPVTSGAAVIAEVVAAHLEQYVIVLVANVTDVGVGEAATDDQEEV